MGHKTVTLKWHFERWKKRYWWTSADRELYIYYRKERIRWNNSPTNKQRAKLTRELCMQLYYPGATLEPHNAMYGLERLANWSEKDGKS